MIILTDFFQNTDQQRFKWTIIAKHVTGENKLHIKQNYKIYKKM